MEAYKRAIALLEKVTTDKGFLASANDITNYRRIWARDGVICGLAALLDGDKQLVKTFRATLQTLADHQHALGNIPSNVFFDKPKTLLSFGGLAGRVDTVAWFIIGVCNYAKLTDNIEFANRHLQNIDRGFRLLEAWEFNNNHLVYVPRSGNWADEYITEGYILYDQLLRLWALRCYQQLFPNEATATKIKKVTRKIIENYRKHHIRNEPYHPKAYKQLRKKNYWVASFNPSGYQKQYDALANAIALILEIDNEEFAEVVIQHSERLRTSLKLQLLPAFWPPIKPEDADWKLLENNCKYEFRNIPYEFHNGGTWQMVNGFYGLGLLKYDKRDEAAQVLEKIDDLNEKADWGFYENFNTETGMTTGVKHCAWSAAGAVLLKNSLEGKELLT
ncbi:amylo-alpha-1,6-glucosidase [Sungkyunkwania multivorans]|uniref:beta-fructofuranosidase n=1 Tax=Sungkyunkwania multivorans TaxID=1173618 RepID=A0ABW3CU38_9FLAO